MPGPRQLPRGWLYFRVGGKYLRYRSNKSDTVFDPPLVVPTAYGLFHASCFSVHGHQTSWAHDGAPTARITHVEMALYRTDPASGVKMSMMLTFYKD